MNPLDFPKKRVGKNFGRKINGKFLKIGKNTFSIDFSTKSLAASVRPPPLKENFHADTIIHADMVTSGPH